MSAPTPAPRYFIAQPICKNLGITPLTMAVPFVSSHTSSTISKLSRAIVFGAGCFAD